MTTISYSAITVPILHFAACGCCLLHGDRSLANEIVVCVACGEPCSCEGCVAEAETGEGKP